MNDLASMMVGREVNLIVEKAEISSQEKSFLMLKNLKVLDPLGAVAVDGISFNVHGWRSFGYRWCSREWSNRIGSGSDWFITAS